VFLKHNLLYLMNYHM